MIVLRVVPQRCLDYFGRVNAGASLAIETDSHHAAAALKHLIARGTDASRRWFQ